MTTWFLRGAHKKWMGENVRSDHSLSSGQVNLMNKVVGFGCPVGGNSAGEGMSGGGGHPQWSGTGKGESRK